MNEESTEYQKYEISQYNQQISTLIKRNLWGQKEGSELRIIRSQKYNLLRNRKRAK